MAKWIQKAVSKHKGALHRELGVPQGEKIPAAKLAKAAHAGGIEGKRARLAETLKGLGHHGSSHAKEKTMRRAHENERKPEHRGEHHRKEPAKERKAHERAGERKMEHKKAEHRAAESRGMKRAMGKEHEAHKPAAKREHEARKEHAPEAKGHKHVWVHHVHHHEGHK